MVRTLARCLALLGLVLPLASCVFFVSAFPPILTQVVARIDLSAVIPAANARDYNVYAVTAAPSEDFVILMNRNGSTDPRVIVLDGNLHLIQTYTTTQLNGWGAFNGNWIMADAAGNIEIGNFGFSAGNLSTVGANPSWNSNPAISGPGFASPAAQRNDFNFQATGGTTLGYTQYHWWLSSDFSASYSISSSGGQFNVVGAYNVDDTPAAGRVILILNESNSSALHIVAIPLLDVLSNALQSPILDRYPNATYANVDSSSVGFAGDSIVAYSYDSHALVRYSLNPPFGVISQLPVGQNVHPITYGYKADGSYSVQLDQTTRILTKVAKWW
jgi:hypothetical protein